jgi:hypothetical protein
MRFVLALVVLLAAPVIHAQTICRLDREGVPHCSTGWSRQQAAQKFVIDSVVGFDVDARQAYLDRAAEKWTHRQRGNCHDVDVNTENVFNAYNYPGNDGMELLELEGCDRAFGLWLFAKENRGARPSELAGVRSDVAVNLEGVRRAPKRCRAEAKVLATVSKAWLAAARRLAVMPEDVDTSLIYAAQAKVETKRVAVAEAVSSFEACKNKDDGPSATIPADSHYDGFNADRVGVGFGGPPIAPGKR